MTNKHLNKTTVNLGGKKANFGVIFLPFGV